MARNYILSSYHQASESFEFLFDKDFFDSLDEDLQALLQYGVEAVSTSNTALALDRYSKDLQTLQNERGVKVHRTSQEILDAELEAWDTLIEELEKDDFMKRCMDSQREWVDGVVFYELMNKPDSATAPRASPSPRRMPREASSMRLTPQGSAASASTSRPSA